MIEQKMRSALLFLAGSLLAAGAWGQSVMFVQSTEGAVTVASEYFGTGAAGRTVSFEGDNGDKQPMVVVEIVNGPTGSTLGLGNEADLTFTLEGATFVSAVTANSLRYYDNAAGNEPGEDLGLDEDGNVINAADVEGDAISRTVKSGGARGDSSVTFTLEVDTAINVDETPNPGSEFLGFTLPALQVVPAAVTRPLAGGEVQTVGSGVTVVATLRSVTTRSNSFPSVVHGLAAPRAASATMTARLADTNGVVPVLPFEDGFVLRTAQALASSLTSGGTTSVSLDDPKVIAARGDGAGVPVTKANGDKVRGLLIAR